MRPGLFLFFTLFSFLRIEAQGTQLLRQPSISDQHIVFVYADDLWRTSVNGGDAIRLTSALGTETSPHISPDGKMVAFTAEYEGNVDVYLLPIEGGEPKRLTWHPGGDIVQGWMPDGQHILFRSGRESVPTREGKFYRIGIEGGMPQALDIPRAYAGEVSPDGKYAAYQMIGFWDPEWRNYRGGQAKPIWIVDMEDLTLKRTPQPDNERHTDPVWLNGKVYFLSERDFANNVWSFDPASEDLQQITFHKDFDVKSVDAGGGKLIYEQGSFLHTWDPSTGQSTQLEINVRGDLNFARNRWEKVPPTSLTNASLSPNGKRALFEYRGEIFTVPKEKGNWRNITQSSGVADRYPVWSPDGKQIAWFSDEDGEYQLAIGDHLGAEKARKIKIPDPTFFFRPSWSPDGKFLAFTDTDYKIWYVEVESGRIEFVDQENYGHPWRSMNPVWSPDSKWMAYTKVMDNQFRAIHIFNVDTKQKHQLTNVMAQAFDPVWDAGGKYLYFLASTDYGMNTAWLDMSSYDVPTTYGLYMALLSKETASPFLPVSDEGIEDEEKDQDDDETRAEKVVVDLESFDHRIIAIDVPLRNYTGLVAGPENSVFYLENIPNVSGQTLHKYDLSARKASDFLTKVNSVATSGDRKHLLYRSGPAWGIVETGKAEHKAGNGKLALENLRIRIEPIAEWRQIFKDTWRFMRDFLYVDNVHGAPWDDILSWYEPWVEHVRHRTDLNHVVDIVSGEAAVGHSYVRGGDFPDIDRIPIGLLGADYEVDQGRFRVARVYSGESWNPQVKAPLTVPGAQVEKGEYIVAVDGKELTADMNLYQLFEGTVGRQTQLTVNKSPNRQGARTITVVPVASEFLLRRWDWVEGNRRKVDQLSDGKLAYVYVPNTANTGYTYFNRYYFAQQDKKGAIIDERNNGGGSAADYMVDVMARELHGYFNSRTDSHKPFTTPMAGLWGPKVMIINERAGSGGDLLPYLFRKMEIGPLIGTKTWGGLVGTWDTPPLLDGGRMVAPRGGFFDVNGEWAVEGVGIAPDIEVLQTPADVAAGRDPQLERAVQEALKLMETESVELKSEPAAPVRWKRPE